MDESGGNLERVLNRHVGEKVLEPWAYARKKIIESTVRETLIVCGFSEEMTCYLSSDGAISQDTLLDTICEAPITLDDKLRLIDRMSEEGSLESKETSSLISERHQQLSVAAEALYSRTNDRAQGKVFSLFTEWYDTDELRLKSETSGLFTTLDAVEDFIRKKLIMKQVTAIIAWSSGIRVTQAGNFQDMITFIIRVGRVGLSS